MDDTPVDVRVASLPASDHEGEEGEILDEAMDVLDSQAAVPPTLEAATAHVLIDDIPVAAVQAPMTSVVAEVTMGENLVDDGATVEELVEDIPVVAVVAPPTSLDAEMTMGENPVEVGGASEPAYDREVEKGQITTEAVPTTSKATTVEVGIADIPVAAVQAPPTSVAAEVTMGESVVVHGGASEPTYDHEVVKRQLFPEAVPTTLEAQETAPSSLADSTINPERFQELVHNIRSTQNDPHPVAEGSTPTKIQDVQQEVPTPGTTANLDKVVLDVSDYLPIVSPDVTQNARESSGISNDREMLKVLNNFCEAVPLEQDLQTSAPLVESDTPESSTRVPDPKMASGPQSEADLEAIGRGNVVESVAATKDDTERGLPMNVAIGVPFDVESMREYFPSYNDKQWAGGKINIVIHCTDQSSSTPEGNETSPGTKKPMNRKLNLNPPKSRSPSPEVPRRIQPGRKGKRKVDEEATANIERKGKRKADEQPSPEPAKKKERSDDSDEDSDKSIREQGEPIQYTRFAELGESKFATKFKEVRLRGHSESIANCDELNFLVTRNEKPVYPTYYDDFLEARKFGLKGSQWEKYAGVIRDDLEVKCPVCQDYIGLLPHMCPGTCACKYHIGCFWPAASRRSVCTVCKVPFASKTYEFFNTRHIPPASKGSINPDTGELELDADQALDNEIHADVMAGRRDSFGPNNVDRARQSEDDKLWRHLVHKFLQIWHHGNGDVKFHTWYMKMEDPSLRSALEHTHNRLVQELEEEGRNNGLEESYIERMVSVFNDHINKTGDKNVKPMVYLRDWDENADAAGPSYAPMEISSEQMMIRMMRHTNEPLSQRRALERE
ncbi:hypothetical protein R1sor_019775 [Riccia sorocarpa]|uniref:RING-type domain-containing protein n=1 Tax=Riccia sorocarpa TaxID=122646 RepID=A0ABD3IDG3_9MARC